MKLFVILSVIACGYAAKLDRTYLPPASAATAGGSPGALNAPFGDPSGFGQPSRTSPGSSFGPSGSGASGFGKPSEPSGALSGPAGQRTQSGFGQPAPQYGAPAQSPSGAFGQQQGSFGQPQTFGQQSQGPQPAQGSFGQAPSSFEQGSQGAGGFSPETYQQQPERAQSAADRNAEILRYDNQNDGETFSYSFETSNGISAEESGVATNGVQAQGGFSYTGDDGQVYSVQYTADENGYLPRGDHLPTPPPIPEEILRAIEKNAAAAAAGTQEGAYNPDEDNSNSIQQYNAPSFNQQGQAQPGSSAQGQYKQPQAQGPSGFNQPQPQGPSAYNQPQGQGPSTYNQQQEQGPASYNQQGSSRAQGSSRPASGSYQTQAAQGQQPSQYNQGTGAQRPSGSFGQAQGRPQVGGQSQDQSGYQYNRPQSQFGGVPNNQGPANQEQYQSQNAPQGGPQQAPQQYNRPAPSQFSRPSLQSAPSKPSFGSNQGSFRQYNNGPAGPSANGPSNNQIPFGQSPASSQGPRGSQSSQPSRAMPQLAPYQYNRPGTQPSQSGQSGPSQFGQKSAPQQGSNQPGQFPSSRQPPSFSEQDGYKY